MRVSFSSMWVPAAAMLLLPLAAAFSLQSPGLAARGAIAIGLRPTYSSMTRRATQGLKMGATDAVPKTLPRYTKFLVRLKVAGKDASLIVGLLFAVACFGWAAMLYPAIGLCYAFGKAFDQKRRRAVDWIVHWWAKLTCLTILYKPKVIGRENLPAKDEAVMYIPNHCSYLDIFTLSGFLPRAFKYVSKIEILRIPLIGWAMQAAGHIAIRRMDKRSQLQTFKDTVECLNNGNSIVTFAEGTRSASGRLMPFKKGPIKMAIKAKKRIVPISICDRAFPCPTRIMHPPALCIPRRPRATCSLPARHRAAAPCQHLSPPCQPLQTPSRAAIQHRLTPFPTPSNRQCTAGCLTRH